MPRSWVCLSVGEGVFVLQSHSSESENPMPVAYLLMSVRFSDPLPTRQFRGNSVLAAQYFTVPQSKLCSQIGHFCCVQAMVERLYFFRVSRMVCPISNPYKSRYIWESLASMRTPPSRPSGLRLPLCCSLNLMHMASTSSRVGKVNLKSKMLFLPGAWSCLIPNRLSSLRVKLSVHQSVLFLPPQALVEQRVANYEIFLTLVILVRKGSCITNGYFYLVQTMSSSMKSAPWYSADSNASMVFSGRSEDRPRWAMFRGRPCSRMQGAGLGRATLATASKTSGRATRMLLKWIVDY